MMTKRGANIGLISSVAGASTYSARPRGWPRYFAALDHDRLARTTKLTDGHFTTFAQTVRCSA
jgi:hypothetical protein